MTPNPNPAQKMDRMSGSDAVQCAGHTTPNQDVPDPASRSLPTSVTQGYMCLSDTAEVQGYVSIIYTSTNMNRGNHTPDGHSLVTVPCPFVPWRTN